MNQSSPAGIAAPGWFAAAVGLLIIILLSPLLVVGYVLYMVKFLQSGSRSGGTAQAPLMGRWSQHNLSSRPDEPAQRLMAVLPGVSHLGLRLMMAPLRLAYRASGYLPKTFRYPFEGEVALQDEGWARQTFFDALVDRYARDLGQFVNLGAGFDTRALRLPPGARVRCFEVDLPKMQAVKREALQQAGLDAAGVTFVAADFEKDDWLARLVEAGFDRGQPALLVWEGVTMYLDRAAVEATLRQIARLAKGTVVGFDYYTTEVLQSPALMMRYVRFGTRAAGEPLKFGMDSTPPSRERLAELLQACGLTLAEQRTLGKETEGKRAWGGFAVATVK